MRAHRWMYVVAALTIGAGITAAGQPRSEARKAYDAMDQAMRRAVTTGNAAEFARSYTDDATIVEEDGHLTHGRAAIEQRVHDELAAMAIKSIDVETSQFDSHGPLAYGAGTETFTFTDRASGRDTTGRVHFLLVIRQQPDRHWLATYFIETPMKAGTP